jgi:hypothetical protein
MSVLHFSGHFTFHMPEYNNAPRNRKEGFNATLSKEKVLEICGCDPTHHFGFRFFDVKATQHMIMGKWINKVMQ